MKAEKLKQPQEQNERIPAEERFGNRKRKDTLDPIMARLAHTSESAIHIGIIMLNPNKWLAVPPSRSLFTIDPIWESF